MSKIVRVLFLLTFYTNPFLHVALFKQSKFLLTWFSLETKKTETNRN